MRILLAPLFLAVILATIVSSCPGQTILRVDQSIPPGGDGLTWETAFADLQDALDTASGISWPVQIWVAAGTYRPDRGSTDVTHFYNLRADLDLLGASPVLKPRPINAIPRPT